MARWRNTLPETAPPAGPDRVPAGRPPLHCRTRSCAQGPVPVRALQAPNRRPRYAYLHNAIEDHSRLAYTEILEHEKKENAAEFWERANAYFTSAGITVKRALTDNGSCHRSHTFRDALGTDVKHKRTRPYRPLIMAV
jgi:Integrase core domain